jgi:hypothetical protein
LQDHWRWTDSIHVATQFSAQQNRKDIAFEKSMIEVKWSILRQVCQYVILINKKVQIQNRPSSHGPESNPSSRRHLRRLNRYPRYPRIFGAEQLWQFKVLRNAGYLSTRQVLRSVKVCQFWQGSGDTSISRC